MFLLHFTRPWTNNQITQLKLLRLQSYRLQFVSYYTRKTMERCYCHSRNMIEGRDSKVCWPVLHCYLINCARYLQLEHFKVASENSLWILTDGEKKDDRNLTQTKKTSQFTSSYILQYELYLFEVQTNIKITVLNEYENIRFVLKSTWKILGFLTS